MRLDPGKVHLGTTFNAILVPVQTLGSLWLFGISINRN
jgi:hypothetical protein